eukprot:6280059-Prymnesium_polylepis.1
MRTTSAARRRSRRVTTTPWTRAARCGGCTRSMPSGQGAVGGVVMLRGRHAPRTARRQLMFRDDIAAMQRIGALGTYKSHLEHVSGYVEPPTRGRVGALGALCRSSTNLRYGVVISHYP